jgi:homocitrate synthase NifV
MMILRVQRLRKTGKTYEFFPEMADLLRKMTGEALNKPIIGKRLFYVESGIHADGVLKLPKCYEPFPPEIIGQTRKIVLGKESKAL